MGFLFGKGGLGDNCSTLLFFFLLLVVLCCNCGGYDGNPC